MEMKFLQMRTTAFQQVTIFHSYGKSFIARLPKLHRKFGIGEIYLSQLEFGMTLPQS